jgi:aminoglycoside phosphotransferase (APT) family kinase protein
MLMELLAAADTAPVLQALARQGVPEDLAVTTRHLSWIEETLGDDRGLDEGVAWLKANKPQLPEQPRLVHGDLWPANVLFGGGALCGLVDWTMGAVGDPALDVGFAKVGLALMPEPFPPPPPLRNAVHACGSRMARQIHERGAPLVGGDSRVSYYEALRCMVQIAVVYADRQAGRENGWEHGIPALVKHLNTVTGIKMATPQHPH